MVYITGDGTLCNNVPWGFRKIVLLFQGLLSFVLYFFQSLFGFENNTSGKRNSSGSSRFFGGGGGGGGDGGFRRGPGGGGPRRFRTMGDINPPTVNAGGCPGGSCGM